MAATHMVQTFAKAGLPPGVLQLVTGEGVLISWGFYDIQGCTGNTPLFGKVNVFLVWSEEMGAVW